MTEAPRLPPAYRLLSYDSLGSTNDEAKRLAQAGAEEGTLVWAREQTAGHGRRGRSWSSPPGNLYLSLVLRPDCPPAEAHQLGFIAALAVGETCGALLPPLVELRYKWPNDVLLNGRKVCGILLESESRADGAVGYLILGVGLNVVSSPDLADYEVTSLREEGAAEATAEAALDHFARAFLSWTDRWVEDGFAPVRAAWLRRAARLGEEIRVRLGRETLLGRFADLDADGALLLDAASGRRRITAGEVFTL